MAVTIRAHFDGKVIVPDEPVDLPVNQRLEVEMKPIEDDTSASAIAERLRRLAQASGRIAGPVVPLDALRRESLYEERG